MKKILKWIFSLLKIFKKKMVNSLEITKNINTKKTEPYKGYYRPKKFNKPLPKKRFRNKFIKNW